jgi:reactive chlorine resistance protein C
MASMDTATGRSPASTVDARIALAGDVGVGVLRYGVVFLLVAIGAAKYFAFEAEAIKPLVENSPFLSWMLRAFGVQGASSVIGTIEIATAIAIASRPIAPAVSAVGSALGIGTFLTTLSFLFSTPGALSLKHPAGGFLLKDIVLLGACITTFAEAARAARARATARQGHAVGSMPMTRVAS